MNLDANDLLLFAQVVEAGSFSRAAERANLPKSTVSRRIAALETQLGERLLTRSTRQLAITEFGQGILEHARPLLDEARAAADYAQFRQAVPRGRLRVSMPGDFAEWTQGPLFLQFAARYPEVKLELDLSPRRVDILAEQYDLALRIAERLPDDATLVAQRLIDIESGLFASPAYLARYGAPTHPDELMRHTALQIIGSSGDKIAWQLRCGDERWEGMPDGPVAANSVSLLRLLACHGLGIAGISTQLVREQIEAGLLVRLLPDWHLPRVTVWAVTPGRRLQPVRTKVFIETLRELLTSNLH